MLEKNSKILSIVNYINETIESLLEEGTIVSPSEGEVPTKMQKFIVIEDGDTKENTDTEFYIELSEAKQYDVNANVGDEIEIEVLDFDVADDEGILSVLSSDDVSIDDLKQLALGQRTTMRVGGKLIKYGPRSVKKLIRLSNKAIDAKRYISRYGKKVEHSVCYCIAYTKDGVNDDGDIDEGKFKDSIIDQPEFIQDNLLKKWKYCTKKYKKEISKKDDRQETEMSCIFIDDWYTKSEKLMDDMVAALQNAYKISGYGKKIDPDTKKVGTEKSVGERIATQDGVEIKFSETVEIDGSEIFRKNSVVKFRIKKTFNERNNTVLLKKGSGWYVMGFDKFKTGEPQTDGYFAKYDAGTHSVSSKKTTWSGMIMSYIN